MTGRPYWSASRIGIPIPSNSDGNTSAQAAPNSATRSSDGTEPSIRTCSVRCEPGQRVFKLRRVGLVGRPVQDQGQGQPVPIAQDRQRLEQTQMVLVRERHRRVEQETLGQAVLSAHPGDLFRAGGVSGNAERIGMTAILPGSIPNSPTISCLMWRGRSRSAGRAHSPR